MLLQTRGLGVRYGAFRALEGVDFDLRAGEVHALMGENGAGKSTLIKCLTGVVQASEGQVLLEGRRAAFASPRAAEAAGIATVFQEVGLIGALSVAENICLGREPVRGIWPHAIRGSEVRRVAKRALSRLGHGDLDLERPLGRLPVAVQQLVAIARALAADPKVLILDEPTSSLDRAESLRLLGVIAELRAQGLGIVLITHFLEQAEKVADRVTVLRDGRLIATHPMKGLSRTRLVADMVGREVASIGGRRGGESGGSRAPVVEARGLGRAGMLESVDLSIRPGEVVGLAGLLGSGRTEVARLLFGAEAAEYGEVSIGGVAGAPANPRQAIARGAALCPEDRKAQGVIAGLSVRENMAIALLARGTRRWLKDAEGLMQRLRIKAAGLDATITSLSGGNQQKVLLARWLAVGPRILMLDEPTRGIDIAAKADVLAEVERLAGEGMAVLIISSELEELVRVCDRVVVLRDRRSVAEVARGELTEDALVSAVAGRDG